MEKLTEDQNGGNPFGWWLKGVVVDLEAIMRKFPVGTELTITGTISDANADDLSVEFQEDDLGYDADQLCCRIKGPNGSIVARLYVDDLQTLLGHALIGWPKAKIAS